MPPFSFCVIARSAVASATTKQSQLHFKHEIASGRLRRHGVSINSPRNDGLTKNPSSTSGTKGYSAVPPRITFASCVSTHARLSFAITGAPADDYSAASLRSPSKSLVRETGEFGLMRSRWALCWASTSLSQLADGMTYYSCPDFITIYVYKPDVTSLIFLTGGPRGIRTPDLLNAIETRSQLRYGPGCLFCTS